MSPFAFLSPLEDSQCFLLSVFVHSALISLATLAGILQAAACPMNGCSDPNLASSLLLRYQRCPNEPIPMSAGLCYV
jgi:hypothetical protein